MREATAGLAESVTSHWGRAGASWLSRLPDQISEIEELWSLQVQEPFESSFHYVARAIRADATEVVVKLGVPGDEFTRQVEALRLYGGHGAVNLLDALPEQGAMLLESLRPGDTLAGPPDEEEANTAAATVMRRLWRAVPDEHPFPSVSEFEGGLDWLRRCLAGEATPVPKPLVARAEALLEELVSTTAEPVLLHGDLHHGNILAAERAWWLAIDPKGVVGDPAYEVGPLLYNRLFETDSPTETLKRRIDQMSVELEIERERLIGAALPRAVLAAWPWPVHAGQQTWSPALKCAELLSELSV